MDSDNNNNRSQNPLVVIEDTESDANLVDAPEVQELEPVNTTWSPSTFKKFIDYLRNKKNPRSQTRKYVEGWHDDPPTKPRDNDSRDHSFDHVLSPYHAIQDQQWEQLSGYSSQLGTVKTNSLSAMSQSAVRSRRTTQSTVNRSSSSEHRRSIERRSTDIEGLRPVRNFSVSDDAQRRAVKRRQVIQEILTSESDYVLGLKALTGILSLLETRPAVYHNVQKLREAHEHLLAQLQNVSPPKSATTDAELANLISGGLSKHSSIRGFRGLQNRSLRTRNFNQKFNLRVKLIAADPTEARDVAHVMQSLSMSAGAYVKFCNNKELLKQDLSLLRESIPNWALFDQGIEALSRSVTPIESRRPKENRSMTLDDLLIKPIQRFCKYHLMLKQLSDCTPSSDCPSSDHDIRQALDTIRALGDQVNSATGDLAYEGRIRKTIELQKKLGPFQSDTLRDIYKQLGPMVMCGVLHVTYQSGDHIKGTYMVCGLFDHYLLLAKYVEESRELQPVACLYVWDLKIDCLRNGKGLSCYECLFSWKLVFHHQNNHYEFVLSASSAAEERQWTSEIVKSTQKVEPIPEPRKYSVLTLDVEPFEHSNDPLGRKSSVHSLSTSRTNHNSQHVIIERTHHPNSYEVVHPAEGEIERPRVMPPQGALTLVTRRQDRIRLEQFIFDEYTRDVLPFPGMVLGYQDKRHKKIKSSVHATFTKRSASLSKIANTSTGTDDYRTDSLSKGMDDIIAQPLQDLFPYDDEKGVVLLEASPEAKPPATLKLGKVSRRTTSATRTASQGSKSYGVLGSPTWKSFGSLFHTISPRRHKRTGSSLSRSDA